MLFTGPVYTKNADFQLSEDTIGRLLFELPGMPVSINAANTDFPVGTIKEARIGDKGLEVDVELHPAITTFVGFYIAPCFRIKLAHHEPGQGMVMDEGELLGLSFRPLPPPEVIEEKEDEEKGCDEGCSDRRNL